MLTPSAPAPKCAPGMVVHDKEFTIIRSFPGSLLSLQSFIGFILTLSVPSPQNSQRHSNNSSAFAEKLFEWV